MFESLPGSVSAALGIIKPEPPTTEAVELDEKGQVMKSRFHPETPVSFLMKRKVAVFAARLFGFRDSGRINITAPSATGSISMMMLQPHKRQRLLTSPARLLFLTTLE